MNGVHVCVCLHTCLQVHMCVHVRSMGVGIPSTLIALHFTYWGRKDLLLNPELADWLV